MKLETSIEELKGVGKKTAYSLRRLGIFTIADLVNHYPRRYDDYSVITSIAKLKPGQVTIKGTIADVNMRNTQRGRSVTEAIIDDETGSIKAVWFNQPYLKSSLPLNTLVYVSGELAFRYGDYALQQPTVEVAAELTKNTARIIPVYPETEGISSKLLRKLQLQVGKLELPDVIPGDIILDYNLIDKTTAINQIHFPDSLASLQQAQHRLAFEELLILLSLSRLQRDNLNSLTAPAFALPDVVAQKFVSSLPFNLTDSQRKVAWQIIQDLKLETPMNRLLQGDVGSGKTVVAILACLQATHNQHQVAILAPTDILARQHYKTLLSLLAGFDVRTELLVGRSSSPDNRKIISKISAGEVDIVIGTQTLLQPQIKFAKLGLVIVDEQHRFGVKQRNSLKHKAKQALHFLSMSATPIPRSLALTVYGDLDISSITELPPGRKPIATEVITNSRMMYERVKTRVNQGEQVYVVCPLINESDILGVASVDTEIRNLRKYFKSVTIASLHGKMSAAEKSAVMAKFHHNEIKILVSTTVVEVGIDVANASVMIIENAERFGLATLHQLRGRVGRGKNQSICFLKLAGNSFARQRLEFLEQTADGFVIAEQDLANRGSGELYGIKQHGIDGLKMANLSDYELISQVQEAVAKLRDIKSYPELFLAVTKQMNATKKD